MVTSASSVDWTVVGTEVEALQLEYSWIKEFDPRFNVKYRDDKSYPFLAVTMSEEYPRVTVMRGRQAQGHPLLRAVLARLGDPGHRGHPAAGVPGPDLLGRGVQARRADRPALPARLHRQVLGALRGTGSAQQSTASSPRTSATSWPGRRPGSSAASRPTCGRPRRPRSSSARPGCATTSRALERALEKQAVVLGRRHRLRRHRAGRGPARGGRADLLRARRPGARPARLGRGEGRGRDHRRAGRELPRARSTGRRR